VCQLPHTVAWWPGKLKLTVVAGFRSRHKGSEMQKKISTTVTIFLAGIAGGTVEVVWVMLFCLAMPLQSSLVAEGIAQSFLPQMTGLSALTAGLVIHFVLSLLVASMVAMVLLRLLGERVDTRSAIAVSTTALAVIWAVNFFVILPVVNADFVTLMPYAVTLVSKLGFGVAMGWVFGARATVSTGRAVYRRFALR